MPGTVSSPKLSVGLVHFSNSRAGRCLNEGQGVRGLSAGLGQTRLAGTH